MLYGQELYINKIAMLEYGVQTQPRQAGQYIGPPLALAAIH